MTTTIVKHQSTTNSKGHRLTGSFAFRMKLPKEAVELLGPEVKIRKHTTHYELSKFGQLSEGRPTILSSSGWLTMPSGLIEEWNDLVDYFIDLDWENETVNLVRK